MAFLLSISVNYTCKRRKCLYVAIFFFLLLLLLLISPLPRCREHLKFIIFFSCLISNLRIRKKMIFYRTCSGVPENKFPSSFSRYFRLRINTKDKNSLNKSLKDCPSWNVTIVFQNNFKCCGGVFFFPPVSQTVKSCWEALTIPQSKWDYCGVSTRAGSHAASLPWFFPGSEAGGGAGFQSWSRIY